MKILFTLSLLICCFACLAQGELLPRDSTGRVIYSEVIKVENTSSSELYSRGREWVSTAYNSAPDVLKMDSREDAKLIGKAFTDMPTGKGISASKVQLWYTFKIEAKDGRYRYEFSDISIKNYPDKYTGNIIIESKAEEYYGEKAYNKKGEMKEAFVSYQMRMNEHILSIIESLKASMNKQNTAKKEDW